MHASTPMAIWRRSGISRFNPLFPCSAPIRCINPSLPKIGPGRSLLSNCTITLSTFPSKNSKRALRWPPKCPFLNGNDRTRLDFDRILHERLAETYSRARVPAWDGQTLNPGLVLLRLEKFKRESFMEPVEFERGSLRNSRLRRKP